MNYEFSSIEDMLNEIQNMVEVGINQMMTEVEPEDLGLDRRSARVLYVSDECIAAHFNQRGTLDYYGGFEYVNAECVDVIGNYVFYYATDDRVKGHIETLLEKTED